MDKTPPHELYSQTVRSRTTKPLAQRVVNSSISLYAAQWDWIRASGSASKWVRQAINKDMMKQGAIQPKLRICPECSKPLTAISPTLIGCASKGCEWSTEMDPKVEATGKFVPVVYTGDFD